MMVGNYDMCTPEQNVVRGPLLKLHHARQLVHIHATGEGHALGRPSRDHTHLLGASLRRLNPAHGSDGASVYYE